MSQCCNHSGSGFLALRTRQRHVLLVVLAINAMMFSIEFAAGLLAQSTALLGDSLDMLGDASMYAVTLYALTASATTRTSITVAKGIAMAGFGIFVLFEAMHGALTGGTPDVGLMTIVGAAALLANAVCFALLRRHRGDDLNMRSIWLCTRNDLISNTSVLAAAVAVAVTGTHWPDAAVGSAIALLFLHSAREILIDSCREWRTIVTSSRTQT